MRGSWRSRIERYLGVRSAKYSAQSLKPSPKCGLQEWLCLAGTTPVSERRYLPRAHALCNMAGCLSSHLPCTYLNYRGARALLDEERYKYELHFMGNHRYPGSPQPEPHNLTPILGKGKGISPSECAPLLSAAVDKLRSPSRASVTCRTRKSAVAPPPDLANTQAFRANDNQDSSHV